MIDECLELSGRNNFSKHIITDDIFYTAIMSEEFFSGFWSKSGKFFEYIFFHAFTSGTSVKSNRESMCFIANSLHDAKSHTFLIEQNRFTFSWKK